jgi:hypothetical protein
VPQFSERYQYHSNDSNFRNGIKFIHRFNAYMKILIWQSLKNTKNAIFSWNNHSFSYYYLWIYEFLSSCSIKYNYHTSHTKVWYTRKFYLDSALHVVFKMWRKIMIFGLKTLSWSIFKDIEVEYVIEDSWIFVPTNDLNRLTFEYWYIEHKSYIVFIIAKIIYLLVHIYIFLHWIFKSE